MFKRIKDNGAADDEEREHKIREGEWNYFSWIWLWFVQSGGLH